MRLRISDYRLARTTVRWICPREVPDVLRIEAACFAEPWSAQDFNDVLNDRKTVGMVAEQRGQIVGYIITQHDAHFYRIASVAVHPDFRRQSIATVMVQRLLQRAALGRDRTMVAAVVVEDNAVACEFFRSLGFRAFAIVRDYFEREDGSRQDGYRFVWEGQR